MAEPDQPDLHLDLGGYLAGSLQPSEREEFEAHLHSCRSCRAEYDQLLPIAESLRASEPLATPAPEVIERTLAAVVSPNGSGSGSDPPPPRPPPERPRRRARVLAAVSALAAAVVASGAVLLIDGGQEGLTATLQSDGGASVDLEITSSGEDRVVELSSDSLPAPEGDDFYELWFVGERDGPGTPSRISAGTFRPDGDGSSEATLSAAADPASYPSVEITAESNDGDPTPSPPPLLSADLG